jgi:hypothetical protein
MIALSKRLANYFLNRLPEDLVHWDLALVGTDALRAIRHRRPLRCAGCWSW